MQTWKLLDTGPNPAAYNMSLDEALLARAQAGETMPVLRFYSWNPPAVSFGRFQDVKTAVKTDACAMLGIDVVRRITGGRAVFHNQELTYSVIARTDSSLFPTNVLGAYKVIAAGLLAGLKNLGLNAEIVARGGRFDALVRGKPKEAACFSSPSWYEILINNKKIIGSAQRRVRSAFLQHGSILIDYDPAAEANVIAGGCAGDKVTCIRRELGREAAMGEIINAFATGFSQALGIEFIRPDSSRAD